MCMFQAYSSGPKAEERETVLWVKYEQCDVNGKYKRHAVQFLYRNDGSCIHCCMLGRLMGMFSPELS